MGFSPVKMGGGNYEPQDVVGALWARTLQSMPQMSKDGCFLRGAELVGHCILKQQEPRLKPQAIGKYIKCVLPCEGQDVFFSPLAGGSAAKVADGSWTGS